MKGCGLHYLVVELYFVVLQGIVFRIEYCSRCETRGADAGGGVGVGVGVIGSLVRAGHPQKCKAPVTANCH